MTSLFSRDATEKLGRIDIYEVDGVAYGGWIEEETHPKVCAWKLASQPTAAALAFMANAVERKLVGGANSFEVQLHYFIKPPDVDAPEGRIRQALIDVEGRLVDVEGYDDDSGNRRYHVDWLPPPVLPMPIEAVIAGALRMHPSEVGESPWPSLSRDRFGLAPLGSS